MSKNFFIVLIILGLWVMVIAVLPKKSIPKKEFKADEIIETEPKNNAGTETVNVDNEKSQRISKSMVKKYYDQRYYTL